MQATGSEEPPPRCAWLPARSLPVAPSSGVGTAGAPAPNGALQKNLRCWVIWPKNDYDSKSNSNDNSNDDKNYNSHNNTGNNHTSGSSNNNRNESSSYDRIIIVVIIINNEIIIIIIIIITIIKIIR